MTVACSRCGRKTHLLNGRAVCANANCGGHQQPPAQLSFDASAQTTLMERPEASNGRSSGVARAGEGRTT